MRDRALLAVRIGATINESDARRFERVLEEVQGRWVPWCVEHDDRGSTGSAHCDDPDSEPHSCRWHPQGAFIPDEGDTT